MPDGYKDLEAEVAIEHFGINVAMCLELTGRTFEWLADEVLIRFPILKGFTEGKGKVSDDQARTIARALGVTVYVLREQYEDDMREKAIRLALQAGDQLDQDVSDAHDQLPAPVVSDSLPAPGGNYPEWWSVHGAAGRVPLSMLALDPEQPRQHYDPDELAALSESIRHRGIRQSLTVTPIHAAPWAVYDKDEFPNAFFLVVSGHRRTLAGLAAGVIDAPVEISVYQNQAEHWVDGSLLNGLRADLTPIEQGYELKRLRSSYTLEQLSSIMGRSVPWIRERLALTQLDPWIQRHRLHPEHCDRSKPVLRLKVAAKLGWLDAPDSNSLRIIAAKLNRPIDPDWWGDEDEHRFKFQRLLLEAIELEEMGGHRASDFIDAVLSNRLGGAYAHSRTIKTVRRAKEPRKMRERLGNTFRTTAGQSVLSWSEGDFDYALEGIQRSHLESLIEQAEQSVAALQRVEEILRSRLQKT